MGRGGRRRVTLSAIRPKSTSSRSCALTLARQPKVGRHLPYAHSEGIVKMHASVVVLLAVLISLNAQTAYCQQEQLIGESTRLYGQGRFAEAVETAQRALESVEKNLVPDHANVALALNNLAEFRQVAALVSKDPAAFEKAVAAAQPLHKRAFEIREKTLGAQHSFTLASMVNLARTYSLQRRYDEAEALYKRALGILGELGARTPILTNLAGQANAGLSQIDKARSKTETVGQAAVTPDKTYSNPELRWSISYPANWQVDDRDRLFVKMTRGPATLGIHTITDGAGKTLVEIADAVLRRWEQNMRAVNVFTQESRRPLHLPYGTAAIEIVHHIGRGVVGKSRKIVALVKDQTVWIDAETTQTSWPDYERDFNRIIDSFRARE